MDVMQPADGAASSQPDSTTEPQNTYSGGILKTIMSLRGLSLADESTFDFEASPSWRPWPGARYGPQSPHLQFAKATKSAKASRVKRQPPQSPTPRPQKERKPKRSTTVTKTKPQPSKQHLPTPKRDPPLHLLNIPGEIRDLIYDILAVHTETLYPQIRPIQKPSQRQKGRKTLTYRRFPLEPKLALANRQLRKEVLSVFYGANRFVFKEIAEPVFQQFRMTSPLTQMTWRLNCGAPKHLRHIELRLDARGGEANVTFQLKRLVDGEIRITHSLVGSEVCACLEDEAAAETLVGVSSGEWDLVKAMYHLSLRRRLKLGVLAKKDDEALLWRMPRTECSDCHRPYLTFVGG